MSANPPECYTIDSQARCLRVEIAATRSLVLPLDQFAYAELLSEGKEQQLRLTFATHEILICGHVLRRIEMAIQRLELSALVKLPDRYQALIAENQAKIRDIIVMEVKPSQPSSRGSQLI